MTEISPRDDLSLLPVSLAASQPTTPGTRSRQRARPTTSGSVAWSTSRQTTSLSLTNPYRKQPFIHYPTSQVQRLWDLRE
ncbi:hypothetical protein P153DRAFT_381286 [Dothidotthia symphoricarpi CBS 119687]|uniref:Uncharacterized protein n=1 Tax=Dothidotthia symphoricarpi CBS 119687 TaxID=1392245 RepID=A0A6A6AQP5_9PLEO|nr:uncharacterized protein P153DRAFT_381286 [Dothidotthia symphoricarpi CBS 119687]KAF2134110.1 hypothetical protein P153DRAFT_381286 [Dothidotthia symphoricarpi CBS 119687]